MLIKILNRFTASVIFQVEADSLKIAVELAAKQKANLYGADLSEANLYGADLYGANLSGANLSGADLYGANLSGADLSRANLSRANLYGADLYGANLYGADLYGANLYGANLSGQKIIDGGLRSDGYRFLLTNLGDEGWRIKAGCRNISLAEARQHWIRTRGGTALGDESLAIIDHMERLARIRGWELTEKESAKLEAR